MNDLCHLAFIVWYTVIAVACVVDKPFSICLAERYGRSYANFHVCGRGDWQSYLADINIPCSKWGVKLRNIGT